MTAPIRCPQSPADDHEHCPLHGCVEYVCCEPTIVQPTTAPPTAMERARARQRQWLQDAITRP